MGERDRGDRGEEAAEPALPVDGSLLDPTSGLFAEPFFIATAGLRLEACRRMLRPLSIAVLEVLDGVPEGPVRPASPTVVAAMVNDTLRSSDVAGRLADGCYALLLEDTSEDGAVWTVERLRRSLGTRPGGRTLRAGVACYPGHALAGPELLAAARAALDTARAWQQDRIEVAANPT